MSICASQPSASTPLRAPPHTPPHPSTFPYERFASTAHADSGRHGKLLVDGTEHRVDVMHLPTIVESYKTYDDTNLVKTGDIGQVCECARACVRNSTCHSGGAACRAMRRHAEQHDELAACCCMVPHDVPCCCVLPNGA
eukprot:365119-Chlamydomonas_euryale.AAC.19